MWAEQLERRSDLIGNDMSSTGPMLLDQVDPIAQGYEQVAHSEHARNGMHFYAEKWLIALQ